MNFIKIILKLLTIAGLMFAFTACEEEVKQSEGAAPEETKAVDKKEELVVPVESMILVKDFVTQSIPITGVIEAYNSVEIFPEVNGKVTKVVKKLGDRVTKKDTLAFIDDVVALANYRQAIAQVNSAKNSLEIDKLNLESDKILYKNKDISKLAFDQSVLIVKNAEASLLSAEASLSTLKKGYEDTRIMSPINGFIASKNIDLGTMVSPVAPAFKVVDIKKLKIKIGIPQSLIARAKKGTEAKITIAALGNKVFYGKLYAVSPAADGNTGTFEAEVLLMNTSDNTIKPGMTCKTELLYSDNEPKLVVPEYSVVKRNGEMHVYKIVDGFAKLTPIKDGESFGNKIIVTEGLKAGDQIVVVGMKNLGENTKVTIESVN